jgi:hypothetical protein
MGLLDMIDDPQQMGLLSLGLRLMSTPGKFGAALGQAGMGALGDVQTVRAAAEQKKQRELQQLLLQAQIKETEAQGRQREAQALEGQRKLQEQQRILSLLQQATGPVAPINANAASGVVGQRPEGLQAVGQRKPVDFQGLLAAGVPVEMVKALAESANYGRPKVARTVDVEGPGGAKEVRQYDEYGQPVGSGLPGYVAPVEVGQGDRKTFVKPMQGVTLPVFQSPDSKASVGAQYALAGATRDAAKITASATETTGLRKEFADLPEVKKYKAAVPSYQAIVKASKINNPQADINLIYGLAKLYDPDSVVREGEYATIANSQAIPEWLKGQAQLLVGGGKITDETRRQVREQAAIRLKTYENEYKGAKRSYEGIAQSRGMNVGNVFPEVGKQLEDMTQDIGGGFILKR